MRNKFNEFNVNPYSWAGISAGKRYNIRFQNPAYKSFYDRYNGKMPLRNSYTGVETVGHAYCEAKLERKHDIAKYLEQLLKFVTIYKLGDLDRYADVKGRSRLPELVNVRRLFSFICTQQINVKLTTTKIAKCLNRDHSSIIYLRDSQINFNEIYISERKQCDYILRFANQNFVDIINFNFDDEKSTHSIKSGAWG